MAASVATSASTRCRYLSVVWSATSDTARAMESPACRMMANCEHMMASCFGFARGFVMSMVRMFLPSRTCFTLCTMRHRSRACSIASISS